MAEEQNVVRSVSWSDVFGFSHIFKSFKMAIHPSKLMLAFAAIAITFVLGKWVMDPIWSLSKSNAVMPNEAWALWVGAIDAGDAARGAPPRALGGRAAFNTLRDRWVSHERVTRLITLLSEYPDISDAGKTAREDFAKGVKTLKDKYAQEYKTAIEQADANYLTRMNATKDLTDAAERRDAEKDHETLKVREKAQALERYVQARKGLQELDGPGVFGGLMEWEDHCLENALIAVRRLNFTGGTTALLATRAVDIPATYRNPGTSNATPLSAALPPEVIGLLGWLVLMAWGVWWMLSTYPLYALAYVVVALAVWSLFGGAVCRICALHSAREEKISMGAALRFSLSKFLSFFFSPLLPLIILACLGAALFVGGLIGAIPYFGEWFTAGLFLVALILGLAMAFLLIGLAGGAPLMWPTIAAEGSDAFDAISRSFSYVYARPFRCALYWAVAAVYGAVCYLFVRLFALVALRATHCCAGWGMGLFHAASREPYGEGAGKLDVLWPQPTYDSFVGPVQVEAVADGSEWAAAHVINLWVHLVSGVVIAVLICLAISAATNIYFLLRRHVDATDLDDVYIEEPEAPTPATDAAAAGPGAAPAGEPAPPTA